MICNYSLNYISNKNKSSVEFCFSFCGEFPIPCFSDPLINWMEFRDVFWPLVNGGMISDDDLTRWFDIIDFDQKKSISTEQ